MDNMCLVRPVLLYYIILLYLYSCTVKPFNLAALKVGDFACKIILAPFILAN